MYINSLPLPHTLIPMGNKIRQLESSVTDTFFISSIEIGGEGMTGVIYT